MSSVTTDLSLTLRRGDTYKLFAACFYEPEKQLFLEENLCENLVQLLQGSSHEAAEAAKQMSLSLEKEGQEKLSVDHAALFLGPFQLIAPPYGSVWMEKQRQIMGGSTMRVIQFYEEANLHTDVSEPPDHIAIMLEFMSYLCRMEAEALSQSATDDAQKFFDIQRRFFNEALSPWIADFCEAITKGTQNSFYSWLATTLLLYIIAEREIL